MSRNSLAYARHATVFVFLLNIFYNGFTRGKHFLRILENSYFYIHFSAMLLGKGGLKISSFFDNELSLLLTLSDIFLIIFGG